MHQDNHEIYIIGHSYGGWLALQTILKLREHPMPIYLNSIDPISPLNCTYAQPFGCTTFPKDITSEQREEIRDTTTRWLNHYQKKTIFLPSSSAPQADANFIYPLGHSNILTAESLWERVYLVQLLKSMPISRIAHNTVYRKFVN